MTTSILNSRSKSHSLLVAKSEDGRTAPHQFTAPRPSRSTRQGTRARAISESKSTPSSGLAQREARSVVGNSAVLRPTQDVADNDVSRQEEERRGAAGTVVDDDDYHDDDVVGARRRRRTTEQVKKVSGASISSEDKSSVPPRSEDGNSRRRVASSTGPTTRSKRRTLEEPHQYISKTKRVRRIVPVDSAPGPCNVGQKRYEQLRANQGTQRKPRAVENGHKSPSPVLDVHLAQGGGGGGNQATPSVGNDDVEDDEGEREDDEGERDDDGGERDEEAEEVEEAEDENDLEYDTMSSDDTDRSGSEDTDNPLQSIADEMWEWLRDTHPLRSNIIISVVEAIDQVEDAYEQTITSGDFTLAEREFHRLEDIIKGLKSDIENSQDILDLYGHAIPKLVRLLSQTYHHAIVHRGRSQMVFVVARLIERCYSLASRWAPRPDLAVDLARSIRDQVLPPVRSLVEDVEKRLVRKIRRSSYAKYRQRLKRRFGKVNEVRHRNDMERVAAGHRTMRSQLERIEALAGSSRRRHRHPESSTVSSSSSSSGQRSGPRNDPGRRVEPRYVSSWKNMPSR